MTSIVPRQNPLPDGVRIGQRSPHWMLNQLPVGMLDGEFFVRFVSIFQELGATLLENADNIPNLVDVDVSPDAMVRWLNTWIGGGCDRPVPAARVAAAHRARFGARRWDGAARWRD